MAALQKYGSLTAILKWTLALVLVLNARSLPGAWHYRVFVPLFKIRFKYLVFWIRTLLKSRKTKLLAQENWLTSITPVGSHPFERTVVYKTWASIDDADFNMHLSNSSYPKTLDCSRFKAAMEFFPQFLRAGGSIPLAGTHFHFIREIPIFSPYEVRLSLGGWDEKWLYVVGRFVTKPCRKAKVQHGQPVPSIRGDLFHPTITTPMDAASSAAGSPKDGITTDLNGLAAKLATAEEPDGAILNTISISQVCFKLGRITVPPALVLASNGLASSSSVVTYSQSNPPPHWQNMINMTYKSAGGGLKQLREFYKGGWRNIPPEERWWVEALSALEQERKARLEAIEGVRKGMEGARISC